MGDRMSSTATTWVRKRIKKKKKKKKRRKGKDRKIRGSGRFESWIVRRDDELR